MKQQSQIFLFWKFLLTMEEERTFSTHFCDKTLAPKANKDSIRKQDYRPITWVNIDGKSPKFYQKRTHQYIKQIICNV